jgi:putative nucleotidyltransferase with HDIG domain
MATDPVPRWRESLRRLNQWFDDHPVAYRAVLCAALILCSVTLYPREAGYRTTTYRLGTIQPRTVIGEFDFPINKDPDVLAKEQNEAIARVPPVLTLQDSVSIAVSESFKQFSSVVGDLRQGRYREDQTPPTGDPARRLSQRVILALLGSSSGPALLQQAGQLLDGYLAEGIVDSSAEVFLPRHERVSLRSREGEWVGPPSRFYGPRRIQTEILRDAGLPPTMDHGILADLVLAYARPNVVRDEEATAARERLARESVPTSIGMVLKGEKIIGAHERITAEALRKLESSEYWKQQREGKTVFGEKVQVWIGRLLLFAVCLLALGFYLAVYQPDLFQSRREITLVAVLQAFFLIASGVLLNAFNLSAFLLPLSAAAVLFALVFEPRVALVAGSFLVVSIGLVADLGLAFLIVLASGVGAAVIGVRALRERKEIYRMVLFVALAHVVTLLAVSLAESSPWQVYAQDLIWVVANPLLSAALAFLAVPLVETASGRCTDMTLLELQDLNRPLMKRLMLVAPGTYHHSLMVGALAEAAAQATGANPLLARVLGYYHDIGKLGKPDYFIENLMPGQKNPHDRLAPTMSRLILEGHVREGIELARAEKLPVVVQKGIGEHHGGTVMRFFLAKARKQNAEIKDDDYRYPYPKPTFPESAIVMLADEADAASRSLEDPNPSRVRALVQKILNERFQHGILSESRLSLRDLAEIKESFVPILSALFQGRAAYPGLALFQQSGAKGSDAQASESSGEESLDVNDSGEEAGGS